MISSILSVDVKGEAYEQLLEKLGGHSGRILHPPQCCQNAIICLIRNQAEVYRCACGTGGFFVVILNYMAEQTHADQNEGLGEEELKRSINIASSRSQNNFVPTLTLAL
jgi:type I restriction-modification system DNA methylase subunit